MKTLYNKIVFFLSRHRGIPTFLSHGGMHLITLAALLFVAILMFVHLKETNLASFNQIVYTLYGDTLHNYKLNYLVFEKDMKRRSGNIYNTNDIKLSYGYIEDTTITDKKTINPFRNKEHKTECDLVSIVRYFTKNSIEDTLINSNTRKFYYFKLLGQIHYSKKISNHDRYYYSYSTLQDTCHVFNRVTHAMDHLIEWEKVNPLFNFWIGIVVKEKTKFNEASYIKIKLNDITSANAEEGIKQPLIIEKVIPRPTSWTMTEIIYKGTELENVIHQHGIYISGLDPIKKEKAEKKNLYITVYLGTIITFMLDIIIQLILKWRKLKKTKIE